MWVRDSLIQLRRDGTLYLSETIIPEHFPMSNNQLSHPGFCLLHVLNPLSCQINSKFTSQRDLGEARAASFTPSRFPNKMWVSSVIPLLKEDQYYFGVC